MQALLIKMAVFAVMMVLGFWFTKKGILGDAFIKGGSFLVANVFLSGTVINSVLNFPEGMTNAEMLKILWVSIIYTAASYLFAEIIGLFLKGDKQQNAVIKLSIACTNIAMVGIPVARELYGTAGAFCVSVACIPFNIFLCSWGVWWLVRSKGEGKFRFSLPVPLFASVAALIICLLHLKLPAVLTEVFSTAAGATVPVSMIIIGCQLAKAPLKEAFSNAKVWMTCFLRLIATPVVILLLMKLIGADAALTGSMVICAACPTAVVVTMFSVQYGGDPLLASETTMLTTVLSLATIPLITLILL